MAGGVAVSAAAAYAHLLAPDALAEDYASPPGTSQAFHHGTDAREYRGAKAKRKRRRRRRRKNRKLSARLRRLRARRRKR